VFAGLAYGNVTRTNDLGFVCCRALFCSENEWIWWGNRCTVGNTVRLDVDGNAVGAFRRTADVRSVGYSELFVLSREDVLAAFKDHPEAEVGQVLCRRCLAVLPASQYDRRSFVDAIDNCSARFSLRRSLVVYRFAFDAFDHRPMTLDVSCRSTAPNCCGPVARLHDRANIKQTSSKRRANIELLRPAN